MQRELLMDVAICFDDPWHSLQLREDMLPSALHIFFCLDSVLTKILECS